MYSGGWATWQPFEGLGVGLRNSVVGIVGLGRIGTNNCLPGADMYNYCWLLADRCKYCYNTKIFQCYTLLNLRNNYGNSLQFEII